MKKEKLILFILLCIFPIITFASSFGNATDLANGYHSKFTTFDNFLRFGNGYYGYENNSVKVINEFQKGGLISKTEYEITRNGKAYSYLFEGLPLWTLTKDGNKVFVVSDKTTLESSAQSSDYNTKVTEYVKHGTKVQGAGTRDNPWTFLEVFRVRVKSKGNGTIENGQTETIKYVAQNDTTGSLRFEIHPSVGYAFKDTDCEENSRFENGVLTISNIKNNMDCNVSFEVSVYKNTVTLPVPVMQVTTKFDTNKEIVFSEPKPKSFYYIVGKGYFTSEKVLNNLSQIELPSKEGWTFKGYYVNEKSDSKFLIKGNQSQTETKKIGILDTTYELIASESDQILYDAFPNKYTVTFDKQNGTGGTAKITATYDHDLPNISVPSRLGYTFKGYKTQASCKGTQYYNEKGEETRTWHEAGDTVLYACWEPNKYYIVYNGNGHSGGSMNEKECIYDQDCILETNKFTRSGYRFAGWLRDNKGNAIAPGTNVKNVVPSGKAYYYVKWVPNITITIKADTTKITSYNQVLTYNVDVKNSSSESTTVKLVDTGLIAEKNAGKITNNSDNSASVANILTEQGYTLTIGGNGTSSFKLKVNVTAQPGTKIKEQIQYSMDYFSDLTQAIFTDVETTVIFTKKSDRGVGANVIIVLDRSGSMSGNRMKNAKLAIESFLDRTFASTGAASRSQVYVTTFGSNAKLVGLATKQSEVQSVKNELAKVTANEGTKYHTGLIKAYELLYGSDGNGGMSRQRTDNENAVIFLSDGDDYGVITDRDSYAKKLADAGAIVYTIGYDIKQTDKNGNLTKAFKTLIQVSNGGVEPKSISENRYSYTATTGDVSNIFTAIYDRINADDQPRVTASGIATMVDTLKLDSNHKILLKIGSSEFTYDSISALNSANKGVTYDNSTKKFTVDATKINKSSQVEVKYFIPD